MADGNRVSLEYKGGLIARVSMNGTVAFSVVRRVEGNRVGSVTDRFGRSVQYSSTAEGLLKDVYDVAGRLWQHRCDGRRLAAVVGPRRDYPEAAYDEEGRVVRTKGALTRTCAYGHRRTVVREGSGRVAEFDQNGDGITYAYNNSESHVKWHLAFDDDNRVETIRTTTGRTDFTYVHPVVRRSSSERRRRIDRVLRELRWRHGLRLPARCGQR